MSSKAAKSENQQSLKVLEELLAKLNVSKAQDEINGVSQEIAIFINGDIEEEDAPTKYVDMRSTLLQIYSTLTCIQGCRHLEEGSCQQEGCRRP